MATVYKSSKGNIDYFTPKEAELDKDAIKNLEGSKDHLPEGAYEHGLASIRAQADSGQPVEPNYDALKVVSARADLLNPLARQTRAAEIEMAVALMNEQVSSVETHLKAIKEATGEAWSGLRKWCDEPAVGGAGAKKSGKTRVPADVLRYINAGVQADKDAAAARRAKAASKKASAAA